MRQRAAQFEVLRDAPAGLGRVVGAVAAPELAERDAGRPIHIARRVAARAQRVPVEGVVPGHDLSVWTDVERPVEPLERLSPPEHDLVPGAETRRHRCADFGRLLLPVLAFYVVVPGPKREATKLRHGPEVDEGRISDFAGIHPHVAATHEPELGVVLPANARVGCLEPVQIVLETQARMPGRTVLERIGVPHARVPGVELARAAEPHLRIDAHRGIRTVLLREIRHDRARRRALRDIADDPGDGVVRGALAEQVAHALAGLDIEDSAREAAQLACHARPGQDLVREADAAREKGLRRARVAVLKQTRALEEKLALLREEEAEPVQVELHVVGLDLGEIGVHRQVERGRRRDAVLDVDAEVALERIVGVRVGE